MRRRLALALALLGVLAFTAWRGVALTQRELVATETCQAAAEKRWDDALAQTRALSGTDESAHAALECQCLAMMMKGDRPLCIERLDQALGADPAWIPDPFLAAVLAGDWLARGDAQRALALTVDAGQLHPEDPGLLAREIDARAATRDAAAALDAVAPRVGPGASAELRFVAAERALHYGLAPRTLELLGAAPPPSTDGPFDAWYLMRADALGALGRTEEIRKVMDQWRAAGATEGVVLANHAWVRHSHQLWEGEPAIGELVTQALEHEADLEPAVVRSLHTRRISLLAMNPATKDQALELLKKAKEKYPDFAMEERDILMSDQGALEREGDTDAPRGELVFTAPAGLGGTLLLAPDATEPIYTLHERHPLTPGGKLNTKRVVGRWPVRWVLQDESGATRASGTTWPVEGRTVDVAIEARPPTTARSFAAQQGPRDGRRRVFLVILDSADWRLVTYLMARGELPAMAHMYQRGLHAVLDSNPAFTAAAMKTLTRPDEPRLLTMPIALHGLGEQLTTFFQLGDNPVGALAAVVPNEPDLFSVLSRGDRVVANMLHGHGGLNAGVHGQSYGPRGARGQALSLSVGRALRDEERTRFAGLVDPPQHFLNDEVKDTAAQFDDAVGLAKDGRVDLLLLRVPATDHSAHATFMTAARGGQEDGQHFLYELYRYCDERLGQLHNALDEDDVLVVMSDHGLSSHMAHDRRSLFLVVGGDVPVGRSKVIVPLFGLPRMLADLLEVPTEWRKSGLEGWLKHLPGKGEEPKGPGEPN